jgi:hypothetical protein
MIKCGVPFSWLLSSSSIYFEGSVRKVVKGIVMSEKSASGARVWGWLFVVLGLGVVLVACSTPVEVKPEITLRADKTSLSSPGDITLIVDVIRGRVDSVTFKTNKSSVLPPVTVPNKDGDFVATVTVQETTTFTAEATGPGGTTTTPAAQAVTVTVAPVDPPRAPSSSTPLRGFENVNLTVGTPTGLTVVAPTIPGVTGSIVGNVQAETKTTSKGRVTIQAAAGKLEFLYTPNTSATGADFFEYTVTNAGGTAKGKIDISLAALSSADFQLADSLAEINDTSKSLVFLTSDVTCTRSASENTNPCVRLDNNQSLIGLGSATVNGVTLTNASSAKPKIIASFAETRKSGTASCGTIDALLANNPDAFTNNEEFDPRPNCEETKVVILRDNTTVEGIEITSNSNDESSTYFVAIYARADRAVGSPDNVLDGNIKIKNVTINRSNGKPIYLQYTFDADGVAAPEYGNYNLEIDGLDLNDANDTLVIGNPRNLTFRNSTIELLQPKGNNAGPQPFGDNSGVQIANYVSGNIILDNVDVFMESTKYRIDFMPESNNGTPIEVFSDTGFNSSVTTNLTIKNSDITYGPNGILSPNVASFRVIADGATIAINSSESTNNKSVRRLAKTERNGGSVEGDIQFNP